MIAFEQSQPRINAVIRGGRKAYGVNPEDGTRTDVIIGTTNNRECLPLTAGRARRWVPIEIAEGIRNRVQKYLDDNRNQLWAEAVARKDEVQLYYPRELEERQTELNREYMNRDQEFEEWVLECAEKLYVNEEPFSMHKLITKLKQEGEERVPNKSDRQLQIEIGIFLQNDGYQRTRSMVAGKRQWRIWLVNLFACHTQMMKNRKKPCQQRGWWDIKRRTQSATGG